MSKDWLFEVSWEVCNMVGGIHTVIASKAASAMEVFGDNYVCVGPLLGRNPGFVEADEDWTEHAGALERLRALNIQTRVGRWNCPGSPKALLISFNEAFPLHDKLLFELWSDYGVDSMSGGWDYVEPVLFSTCAAMAIEELAAGLGEEAANVHAHFHEWMSGAGVLRLKKNAPAIATVLTTHATMLGRAMSGAGVDIYARLEEIEPFQEARIFGVSAKHSMETVSAREADCFATVSNITRTEARHLLGTNPAVVTPNGFDLDGFPNYAQETGKAAEARARILEFASAFLERDLDPDKTLLVATSGRYEFHNKGIDVLIDGLGRLQQRLADEGAERTVVSFLMVTGGYAGFSEEARRMKQGRQGIEKYAGIATHHLGDAERDPVVRACRDRDLDNEPESRCPVIFIPVYLDGNDGVLNLEYYDALAGFDLTVFPSFYEPWGYTPLESAAYGVPTLTSDRAGFGQWVMERHPGGHDGVFVIDRLEQGDAQAALAVADILYDTAMEGADRLAERRRAARALAEEAVWKDFYVHYVQAYEQARHRRTERVSGVQRLEAEPGRVVQFSGVNTSQPRLRQFSVISDPPPELARLRDLAGNLWWVWNTRAQELFARINPEQWAEREHNPVRLINEAGHERLGRLAADQGFLAEYRAVLESFDAYMAQAETANVSGITWGNPVAYFSMEFGLHECIPTYSGGLGLLAGDHIKSASDLNLPFVGVSLLYKQGYFRQRVDGDGQQVPEYVESDFANMPMTMVGNGEGRLLITVELPGRTVHAQVWEVHVGRASLYLLDTDVLENTRTDRDITARLYEPSSKGRIEQEILLGVGGVRMLAALGVEPGLHHLNEGHSAFLIYERIRRHMLLDGLDFNTAKEVVRGGTVFTMHTPVPAGNERFEKSLVENYFKPYAAEMGVSFDDLWNIGHAYAEEAGHLNMTVLALRVSSARNGVSRLHGEVSRRMWMDLWRGFLLGEVPVGHVTNGVHAQSWLDPAVLGELEPRLGRDIHQALLEGGPWDQVEHLDDDGLWRVHTELRHRLYNEIRERISEQWTREGEAPNRLSRFKQVLDPDALTICFARRFTTYKRPTLILQNLMRLKQIMFAEGRPVNLVFAGKAHPADTLGAEYIHLINRLSKQDDFIGRIVFLENYDIRLARLLVSGADVWLNNPTRLMEASGTSGMKASMNGVVNLSILDGWWDEAFDGTNGWAIGQRKGTATQVNQDLVDAETLYDILERQVVPDYYERGGDGVSQSWTARMKRAMRTALSEFNTHRMVREYIDTMYVRALAFGRRRKRDDFALAREIGEWRKRIPGRFSTVTIREVKVHGAHGNSFKVGEVLRVTARVDKGQLSPSELAAELVAVRGQGEDMDVSTVPMALTHREGDLLVYEAEHMLTSTGQWRYGLRVLPTHPGLTNHFEARLVRWS